MIMTVPSKVQHTTGSNLLGRVFLTQLNFGEFSETTKSPKFLSANYSVNEIHDIINFNIYCMDVQNRQNEKR